jgi:hypothetical protein
MIPAPSGLQDVDGLNHLLGSLRRCTPQSFHRIDTNKCRCSFAPCPFNIFTSRCARVSRIKPLARVPTSTVGTALRYFIQNTIFTWISNTVCAPLGYSPIPLPDPAARALKPSPERRGLLPSQRMDSEANRFQKAVRVSCVLKTKVQHEVPRLIGPREVDNHVPGRTIS